MEPIRRAIEGFLRGRYSLAELFRVALAKVVPVLTLGAILATLAGYLLTSALIPRFSLAEGPTVRNGVAVIVVCGKKQGMAEMGAAMKYVPEPQTGTWETERSWRGDCTVWYHYPPDATQRENRQQRAATEGVQRSPSQFQRLPVVEKLPQSP